VEGKDAFHRMKEHGEAYLRPDAYEPIEVPRNSAMGPVIGVSGAAVAFGLVWHIWWMACLGLLVIWGAVIARSFVRNTTRVIPASEVEATERRWLDAVSRTQRVTRDDELQPANRGLAVASAT